MIPADGDGHGGGAGAGDSDDWVAMKLAGRVDNDGDDVESHDADDDVSNDDAG